MPEIAEVRVVASTLKKQIINKKIKKINILYNKIIENDIEEFKEKLTGKTFKDVKTFGKWIIFELGEYSLLSHLRMEGKYYYEPSDSEIKKHTHIIFSLDNNMDLRYNDTRKFGRMLLVKTNKVFNTPCISKLGLEPDDKRLNEKYLLDKFSKINKPIKDVLLDQTIINGLGNIYANEVLFEAKINPLKEASKLSKKDSLNIINSASNMIKKSYEMGGCTIRSYTSSLGVIGHFQDCLKVHMQDKCKICDTPINKIKINGRSTYYCPRCQK